MRARDRSAEGKLLPIRNLTCHKHITSPVGYFLWSAVRIPSPTILVLRFNSKEENYLWAGRIACNMRLKH